MRYVDDLTKVKPEEIRHKGSKYALNIVAIVHCPKAKNLGNEIVIVYEDGDKGSYTLDGRALPTGEQYFIYRPRKLVAYVNFYDDGATQLFPSKDVADHFDRCFHFGTTTIIRKRIGEAVKVELEVEK